MLGFPYDFLPLDPVRCRIVLELVLYCQSNSLATANIASGGFGVDFLQFWDEILEVLRNTYRCIFAIIRFHITNIRYNFANVKIFS